MNAQDFELVKVASNSDSSLYSVKSESGIEIFIASDPNTIDILNRPERIGVEFQRKLSNTLQSVLSVVYQNGSSKLASTLKSNPIDVFYLLRGGLNYDLHRSLTEITGHLPEVTFLSSQRVESDHGFDIGESSYQKWSIQDGSVICVGDISATGTTIKHALDRAVAGYANEGKKPKRLLIVTIGTLRSAFELAQYKEHLAKAWGPTFEGITVIYLEGMFHLYEGDPSLSKTHLPFTDFFRKDAPRTLEFEAQSLLTPICFLERCAIYDGGSRAFEPRTYTRNLVTYWKKLSEDGGLDVRKLLSLKSDLLDYEKPFEEWLQTKTWWRSLTEAELIKIHDQGRRAVESLLSMSLKEVCEKRLSELPKLPETGKTLNKKFIDKLAWININNRRILSTRSRGKDTYYIPGGKREINETDQEALIREIREELSINLIPESLEHVGTFEAQAHGQAEGVVVRMTCYSGKYEGDLCCASEVEEMVWFEHKDRERSSPVDKIIFDWLKERDLID